MDVAKEILFKEAALQKLCEGAIRFIDQALGSGTELSKSDQFLQMGAHIAEEAAVETQWIGGGQTTLLLLQSLIHHGQKQIKSGTHPIIFKKNLQENASVVLDNLIRSTPTQEELLSIAVSAAQCDTFTGQLIVQAIQKEIVLFHKINLAETSLEISSGHLMDSGYCSPYFCTSIENQSCEMHKTVILHIDKKIHSSQEIALLAQKSVKPGQSLLIIAEALENAALTTLVINQLCSTLNVCAITRGLARCPHPLAEKVIVYKDKTIVFIPELQTHNIATLQVGGRTDAEICEKKRRLETGVRVSQAAIKKGLAHFKPTPSSNNFVLDICSSLFAKPKAYTLIEQSLNAALKAAEKILLSDVLIGNATKA